MNEGRNKANNEDIRGPEDVFLEALAYIAFLMLGLAIGIGLCKFWPEFWRWVL